MNLRFRSSSRACTACIAAVFAGILYAPTASAEPTAWLAAGGGYAFEHNGLASDFAKGSVFSTAVGVGTNSDARWVFGGVFRQSTIFTLGTDIGLALRIADGPFARGDWGFAFDLGVGGRFWKGGDYGVWPIQAKAIGGSPWGLELVIGADVGKIAGDQSATGVMALIEIDLLRATVNRRGSSTKYWQNPSPVGGEPQTTGPVDEIRGP